MARSIPSREDLDRVYSQLEGENDRAVIIVSGSFLETSLEIMIGAYMREPATRAEEAILFSDRGIAGTFSGKIWLAYFMHLIGSSTRHDLDIIRAIRNQAVHNLAPVSSSLTEIAGRCRAINFSKTLKKETNLKDSFLATVKFFSAALVMRATVKHIPETREDVSGVTQYLDR